MLSTFEHRSFDLADIGMVFKPQTDLYSSTPSPTTSSRPAGSTRTSSPLIPLFKRGQTDIGYGLRPEHPLQKKATGAAKASDATDMSFEEYAKFVSDYTLEKAAEMSGVPLNRLEALAELYADPKIKVMSFWTMGFNQHTRGVWCNNLVYNIHLLTGKISEPGNSPFSLTGQPSACGTAREVGTFSHRLPADMVVTNKAHRDIAEQIWKLPEGTIPDKPGYHAVLQNRMLKDGLLNAYWVQVNNNLQAGANANEETYPGYRNPENFIVVSDAYPSVTALAADLILPTAMWVEKEGAYGNAERRTHFWHQMVSAPGESRSDLWQLMEFSKRFKIEEVWPEELLAKKPEYRGKTLFDVLYRNGQVDKFPVSDIEAGYANDESKAFGFYVHKGLFEEYATFGRGHGHDLAPFDTYHQVRGLRWPVVNGQETRWRFREGLDPYVKQRQGRPVLRFSRRQGAHLRAALRAAGGIARQRISVLALDRPRAGALAFRHHDAPRPRTLQGVPGSRVLHASRRRRRAQAAARRRDQGAVAPRLYPHPGRDPRPQQDAARAGVRAVVRRSAADQQGDAGCHRSDLAADRLQEMRRAHRAGAKHMIGKPWLLALAIVARDRIDFAGRADREFRPARLDPAQ